jgi:hypothetical protein
MGNHSGPTEQECLGEPHNCWKSKESPGKDKKEDKEVVSWEFEGSTMNVAMVVECVSTSVQWMS